MKNDRVEDYKELKGYYIDVTCKVIDVFVTPNKEVELTLDIMGEYDPKLIIDLPLVDKEKIVKFKKSKNDKLVIRIDG